MIAPWIASSDRLPRKCDPIEFVLDDRSVALVGRYSSAGFQSQWNTYGLVRVLGWRPLASPLTPPAGHAADGSNRQELPVADLVAPVAVG